MIAAIAAALGVFAPMIGEAVRAARNDRRLRSQGAVEPRGDVYRVMQIAYPACFLAMLAEGTWRSVTVDVWFVVGSAIFAAAKGLSTWAIASLGPRWTFRVLVPPRSVRTTTGPYRWIAHPNYVAVAGELIGTAIAMRAVLSGPAAVAGFCILMIRRVIVEDRALAGGGERIVPTGENVTAFQTLTRERAQRREPGERREPAKRRASETVGESEGRSPSDET